MNGAPVDKGSYEIEIQKYVSRIEFDPRPEDTSYIYKDRRQTDPNLYNGKLKVTYYDGTVEFIEHLDMYNLIHSSKIKVHGFDLSSIGTKTMTLEYEGCSIELKYNVSYAWWQWLIRIFLLGFLWY